MFALSINLLIGKTDEVAQWLLRNPSAEPFLGAFIYLSPVGQWGGCPKHGVQAPKLRTVDLRSCRSLMRTEVLQATLKLLGHLTSYGLLSCNQCEVFFGLFYVTNRLR